MTIIVSGASGWLGRASISVLLKSGIDKAKIRCFGTSASIFKVDGVTFENEPFQSALSIRSAECFIHLAFKTRDKANSLPLENYLTENRDLTSLAVSVIERARPRSVITISSGAVFEGPTFETFTSDVESNPYGFLKLEEEERLSQVCQADGITLVINRLWGVSGRDIQNVTPYALAEFITRASKNESIEIRSPYEVWRRYVDARELMQLCLKIAQTEESILFDSGGPLTEIEDLAHKVVDILGSSSQVIREPIKSNYAPDLYYSKSSTYEELLLEHLKSEPSALDSQIIDTAVALTSPN